MVASTAIPTKFDLQDVDALIQAMAYSTYKPRLGAHSSLLASDLDNISDPALRPGPLRLAFFRVPPLEGVPANTNNSCWCKQNKHTICRMCS